MSPKLWLPLSYTIKEPTSGREMMIFIPGADSMDRSQLQEIIAKQEEVVTAQLKAKGPVPRSRYSRKERGRMLNEFHKWASAKSKDPGFKSVF